MKNLLKPLSFVFTMSNCKKQNQTKKNKLHNNVFYFYSVLIWKMWTEGVSILPAWTLLQICAFPLLEKDCPWLQPSLGLPGFQPALLTAGSRADCPEHDLLAPQPVWLNTDLLRMFSDYAQVAYAAAASFSPTSFFPNQCWGISSLPLAQML